MTSKILCIVEGEKTELAFFKSIKSCLLVSEKIEIVPFKADVYQLYKTLSKEDENCYIEDLFSILKNKNPNNLNLKNYNRDDFAEIYLFFDYDGHATNANTIKINDLLNFFDNETDNGKLYISYPMVEANKDNPLTNQLTNISLGKNYKKLVNKRCENILNHIDTWSIEIWKNQILNHLKAAHFLLLENHTIPNYSYFIKNINQINIFENQLNKHINTNNNVSVLGSFIFFICEYRGEPFFENDFNLIEPK